MEQTGGILRPDMSGGYERFHAEFSWSVPETFNFGADVIDRLAREADGPALIWESATGEERRFTFSDMARLTNRFANVLTAHGVKKGDFVLVMLPRVPEWQIAVIGALKLGAVPIPCIEMLTAKDIDYRVRHSGAKAVVCRAGQIDKFAGLEDMLEARIALGGAPGWSSLEKAMAAASDEHVPATVAAEDPAMMYYTSGSTGNP